MWFLEVFGGTLGFCGILCNLGFALLVAVFYVGLYACRVHLQVLGVVEG